MARPCKSTKVMNNNLSKEIIEARTIAEDKLKGPSDDVTPPDYLSDKQKVIFEFIVDNLKESGILSNLDNFILATCSIAIDRLQEIESIINKDFVRITDRELMNAKDKYTKDLYRTCNELSLSPQSRAKLANINVQANQQEEDPLLNLLKGKE